MVTINDPCQLVVMILRLRESLETGNGIVERCELKVM
jgi:hypothetical protein